MRRFLVVGCGGSGGSTLAYLMDQLRSDLAAHGVNSLPRGWQFVHVDVPNRSEDGPDGLGSVEKQGGKYFGSGPAGSSYGVLDHAVSGRFAEKARLDSIGTWAPRDPEKVTSPISDGAGQYRAVGRMITLSRAAEIRRALEAAWEDLGDPMTASEMSQLQVPGLGDYNSNVPIVLVVSSMAGGAGASMALDVCRLLTLLPGLNPKLMGVFLAAPNIFDTLPQAGRTGVRPNALAMLGEIVASQTGAARKHDVRTLQALGQETGQGEKTPFARVFPVGRFTGVERTRFGDGTPRAVYRGLGRGLAGLIMSGTATDQFVSFDLGNTASPNGNRDLLGWGSEWEPLPWGSYGFASLSMGRDRYAEYSAQRLGRSSVDRLLYGHLQRGSQASANEQVTALLDSQWPGICNRVYLPTTEAGFGSWLTTTGFRWDLVESASRGVTERELQPFVPNPTGVQAAQWLPALQHQLSARRAPLTAEANRVAAEWAFHWHKGLLGLVEQEVGEAISGLGLPYAIAVVERLSLHVREVMVPGAEAVVARAPADVSTLPPDMQPVLAGLPSRGVVANGQQLVDQLVQGYRNQVRMQIYAHAAEMLKQLLLAFTGDVLKPLAQALGDAQRLLENAAAAEPTNVGLARLATDDCAAWPSDADIRVPARFDHADNEVLLTDSAHFQQQYVNDVRTAVEPVGNQGFEDMRSVVVQQVISGNWKTTGGTRAPYGLLERTAEWRSRVYPTDPITGQPVIPSPARYDVHVRPPELLGRARLFVARPGESFNAFCRLSIRDYVLGYGAAEFELEQRQNEVVAKFTEALTLARPLISVNGTALQVVHSGEDIKYRYKFSEVPFKALPTAERLLRVLETNPMIDRPSRTNLEKSVGDGNGVTRIDIFGSYPNYSPLVFDAVLGPVAEQWAEIGDIGRESFWQWRRSRPLDAALPMGDSERQTMVAGWFLGQIVGRIRIPAPPFTDAVKIWDDDESRWLDFPHPLLTPPSRFVADYDWLPAVLESVLLAIARSHHAPVMSSLRPYQVLRGLYDNSSQGERGGINILSATTVVRDWLAGKRPSSGGASRVAGADDAGTVDQRADLTIAWLERIQRLAVDEYMSPEDGGTGQGAFSQITKRRQASGTPMFRDLAPDVAWATRELINVVTAERAAANDPTPLDPVTPVTAPNPSDRVPIPEGGTF